MQSSVSSAAAFLPSSFPWPRPGSTADWLHNLGFIAILSVFGSSIYLALFYLLIRDTSPVFASITTDFIPIIATMWGILDGEQMKSSMLVSVLIILVGFTL